MGPTHYANVSKDNEQHVSDSAFHGSKEFAVVAFWDLDPEDDQFKCARFFIVPHPMKRTIENCEGTKLEQVLYFSPNSNEKDVFLFFKGYVQGGDDLEEVATDTEKEQHL